VIEPDEGRLASRGEHGRGRLPDLRAPARRVEAAIPSGERPWDGLQVLVSAGGTREPIDPVRFVGNRSKRPHGHRPRHGGREARGGGDPYRRQRRAALSAGHRPGRRRNAAELAREMADLFVRADVLLMAAAPADFRPSPFPRQAEAKDGLELRMEATDDILGGSRGPAKNEGRDDSIVIVGFAAETGGTRSAARARS